VRDASGRTRARSKLLRLGKSGGKFLGEHLERRSLGKGEVNADTYGGSSFFHLVFSSFRFADLRLLRCFWSIKSLAQVGKQLLDPFHGTLMPFRFSLPPSGSGVLDDFQFTRSPPTQAWGVFWGGHKFGAREIQVTFTRTLLWKT
jgi:hypothetical protein